MGFTAAPIKSGQPYLLRLTVLFRQLPGNGHQPAVFNGIYLIAQLFNVFIAVGREENRFALRFQHTDNCPDILIRLIVQGIKRFIQNQNILSLHNGLCQSQFLFHAKGIVINLCLIRWIKPHLVHGFCNFLFAYPALNISQEFQVLETAVNADKTGRVNEYPHIVREIPAILSKLPAAHIDVSIIRFFEAAQYFEQH